MRVLQLTAENVKGLRAIDITPAEHVQVIAGRNGQGKSSTIDAIWLALGGGAASRGLADPVRHGETHAEVTVDLGDYQVTRTWSPSGTRLNVESPDGARYRSPQALLDGLMGQLTFDPLAFAQMDDRTQLATLLGLVDLPFDTDEMAERRQGAYDRRTDANRRVKDLAAQLDAMPESFGVDLPDEEVSTSDLLAELRQTEVAIAHDAQARQAMADAQADYDEIAARLKISEARLSEAIATVAALPDLPDTTGVEERLATVDETNAKIRAAGQRDDLVGRLKSAKAEADAETVLIESIDREKAAGLAKARMPIEGLAFDEAGVTYRAVPFRQCSAAERLRVSVAMAMALNPTIRVIRITDGSLLDSESMALLTAMAVEHDFQLWVEVVDESGRVGITIEDGTVAVGEVAS